MTLNELEGVNIKYIIHTCIAFSGVGCVEVNEDGPILSAASLYISVSY